MRPDRVPRILFENDGRHPLIYMYEPPIQTEEYQAAVDELAGTPVDALMFCLGDGRTMLHDTRAGELWGHNVEKWPHLIFRRAHQNAAHLIEQGNDPLHLICARAQQTGLRVYPQLLVQLSRGPRQVDCRCSDFRFENTHLEIGAKRIGAKGGIEADWPGFNCLDFSHEAVREERLALVREVADTYDIGGFELQLNYQPYYFHPEEVEAGMPLMTEWIRQVHAAVKMGDADRELVLRVPARLASCRTAGLDVETWIREGLVDVLVGDTFATPEIINSNLDISELVEAAGGHPCRVHAAVHALVDSDRLGQATIEMVRAAACNVWDQGVDGLYLAHWFGMWPYTASFYEILRELPYPQVMDAKNKIYAVPTMTERQPAPGTEPGEKADLPTDLEIDQPVRVEFTLSDDLPRWDSVGRIDAVLLRLRVMNTTEVDRLRFVLNGTELPETQLRRINEMYRMSAPRYRTGSGYWFVFRLDQGTWPKRGNNTLELTLIQRDAAVAPQIFLRDVEVETRYLMGKNFHRSFVDADLGPYGQKDG
jgi:hypothetical protein